MLQGPAQKRLHPTGMRPHPLHRGHTAILCCSRDMPRALGFSAQPPVLAVSP